MRPFNEFLSSFRSRDIDFASCDGHEVESRMAAFVRSQAAAAGSVPLRPKLALKELIDQVQLSLDFDGSLRVVVPAGTEVTIVRREPVEKRVGEASY